MNKLYLFPDTNLFIQCKPLHEIDWSIFPKAKEVHLIVSRPVQKEIDNQKNKPGRLGSKARRTASLLRKLITSDREYLVVKDKNPCVKLYVKPDYNYRGYSGDALDLEDRDDQLVATAYLYKNRHPDSDVRLLTHDTGPMATAKLIGITFEPINNSWLLQEENSDEKKEINRLKTEISRLRNNEPKFTIYVSGDNSQPTENLEYEHQYYEQLSNEEIERLIGLIKHKNPSKNNFNSTTKSTDSNAAGYTLTPTVYVLPPKEEIEKYKNDQYPSWLDKCREYLASYHLILSEKSGLPTFKFSITNNGIRPAKDTLVSILPFGEISLLPLPNEEDQKNLTKALSGSILFTPPTPPAAKRATDNYLARAMKAVRPLSTPNIDNDLPNFLIDGPRFNRDPNKFYMKGDKYDVFEHGMEFECKQWRHNIDATTFSGQLHFGTDKKVISGMLKCTIHAENLSDPVSKSVPVTIKNIKLNAFEKAKNLILG